MAWEFVYNEESGVFSREPNHNWASHPSDGFAYGCQVMSQVVAKEPEKPAEFAIKGVNGRIITQTLDKLWAETPTKRERF
jgi:phage terminase large subunit